MRLRSMDPYEIQFDGEESEDVMDLDQTEVISLLDINHEMLPRDEGVGFDQWLGDRLDAIELDENLKALLDEVGLGDEPEFDHEDDI